MHSIEIPTKQSPCCLRLLRSLRLARNNIKFYDLTHRRVSVSDHLPYAH